MLKSVNQDRAIVRMSALDPDENSKGEAEGFYPTWLTRILSATEPFPSAYFRRKVRSKDFMREIKKAFNHKKRWKAINF